MRKIVDLPFKDHINRFLEMNSNKTTYIKQQVAGNRIQKSQLLKTLCLIEFQTWFWFSQTVLDSIPQCIIL